MLSLRQIEQIIKGRVLKFSEDAPIAYLLLDSRKIISPLNSLFFAIKGKRHDGHKFIADLYREGVRNFVVEKQAQVNPSHYYEANIVEVDNAIDALQEVAAFHRAQFTIPVIGITGSNGKTIVKEWLSQLLAKDYNIVRSPKSYNSQTGVPLSVWEINDQHTLGIFEAGISLPGEMEKLEKIIKPTIGVFTTIGAAHDEGFESRKQKINEKLKLFKEVEILFYHKDYEELDVEITKNYSKLKKFTWSFKSPADLVVKEVRKDGRKTNIHAFYKEKSLNFTIPFSDDASIENVVHGIAVLLYFNIDPHELQSRLQGLHNIAMRLELKEGINSCYIVDDTYNNDLGGLSIAINFLDQQKQKELKTVILSDLLETGIEEGELYLKIGRMMQEKSIDRFIGIGETISKNKNAFRLNSSFYNSVEEFLAELNEDDFKDEMILVKGARVFHFEKIIRRLQQKAHGTVLEVNLDALSNNLNFYRSRLKPQTKVMVMVKAFAYGSGSFEVANLLQFHRVDYLAVAYADEGALLRENGISLPIMVMNPSAATFDKLFQYNLEPEIYTFKILKEYLDFLKTNEVSAKIHLKIDTGMKRLGFEENDIKELAIILKQEVSRLQIASIFTHLAGADEEAHDSFTMQQMEKFKRLAHYLEEKLAIKTLKHALNSAGIVRFPAEQMDMVRLGIGLYGIEATGILQEQLQTVGTLKTIISQIKEVKKGETVGYCRKGKADEDTVIATIAVGYADGYDRRFSNGKGKALVNGKLCPIIGNVCMDMCMLDITGVNAYEGDEVILFGEDLPIYTLAAEIGTIPYEILTNVSERVKRVFYAE